MTTLYELSLLNSPKWWVDKLSSVGMANFAQKRSICQTGVICSEIRCPNCLWAAFMRENQDLFLDDKTLKVTLPKFIHFLEQKETKDMQKLLNRAIENFRNGWDWPKLPDGNYDFFLTHKMLGCDNCAHANTAKIYKGGCCGVPGRPFEMIHDIDLQTARCKRQHKLRVDGMFAEKLKRKAFLLSKIAMAVLALEKGKKGKGVEKTPKTELQKRFEANVIRW